MPPTVVPDHLTAVAANVRRLREGHGLSLSQLSERSGVAKATLFKVERGSTNPTLDTLAAVADAFEVPLTMLLTTQPRPVVEVVRAGGGQDISDDASTGQVLRDQVIGAGTLEIHAQRFHRGISTTSPSHGQGSREHVLVREGRLVAGPVGDEVDLGAGDYTTYPADRLHRWHTEDQEALVWIVHTFPRGTSPLVE